MENWVENKWYFAFDDEDEVRDFATIFKKLRDSTIKTGFNRADFSDGEWIVINNIYNSFFEVVEE